MTRAKSDYMTKTHRIETRFHHDACDLRDALIDSGFEPSEFPRTEEHMLVETLEREDAAHLIRTAIKAANDLDVALWIDGIRADARGVRLKRLVGGFAVRS